MEAAKEDFVETGRITITVGLNGDGTAHGFNIQGMEPPEAIGHLTIITDLLREQQKRAWFKSQGG